MARPKKNKQTEGDFSLQVKVLGKVYSATGKTFQDAVDNLGIKNAKGLSIWTVDLGGKTKERILQAPATFRLLNSHGLYRDIAIKKFSQLFI